MKRIEDLEYRCLDSLGLPQFEEALFGLVRFGGIGIGIGIGIGSSQSS